MAAPYALARRTSDPTRPDEADSVFHSLLDDALTEIVRRESNYFSRFELPVPRLQRQVSRYLRHPLFSSFSETEMVAAFSSAIERFCSRGVRVKKFHDHEVDPVTTMLCDSIADAYAASVGKLRLSSAPTVPGGDLARGFEERRTVSGARYVVQCAGQGPLLLVNACGMSLSLWSRLMTDQSNPWRLIVAESPCTDLVQGGMRAAHDLSADVDAIAAALDDARIDRTDMVAWCGGARIAIEFAGRFPERVQSLALIAPTLRGAAGVMPAGSKFENDLNRILEAVDRAPHLARMFADAFRSQFEFTDWEKLANKPEQRAVTLFGLAAHDRLPALIAPMVDPEFLVNYGRRVLLDQKHGIHASLARLKMPVMLLLGNHDNRVNNAFTVAVLRAYGVRFLEVRIKGAGHYLYDLQYQYFRSVLSAFISDASPTPSARVEVEAAA
jgi:pimeloyl-ACP methyl ester carboxylesterase